MFSKSLKACQAGRDAVCVPTSKSSPRGPRCPRGPKVLMILTSPSVKEGTCVEMSGPSQGPSSSCFSSTSRRAKAWEIYEFTPCVNRELTGGLPLGRQRVAEKLRPQAGVSTQSELGSIVGCKGRRSLDSTAVARPQTGTHLSFRTEGGSVLGSGRKALPSGWTRSRQGHLRLCLAGWASRNSF